MGAIQAAHNLSNIELSDNCFTQNWLNEISANVVLIANVPFKLNASKLKYVKTTIFHLFKFSGESGTICDRANESEIF